MFAGETFRTDNEVKINKHSHWFQTEYVPILHNRKIIAALLSTFEITDKKKTEIETYGLIAELKTSSLHRKQQVEFELETLIKKGKGLLISDKKISQALSERFNKLLSDLVSLRNKINSWK